MAIHTSASVGWYFAVKGRLLRRDYAPSRAISFLIVVGRLIEFQSLKAGSRMSLLLLNVGEPQPHPQSAKQNSA